MNKLPIIIILVIVVVGAVWFTVAKQKQNPSNQETELSQIVDPDEKDKAAVMIAVDKLGFKLKNVSLLAPRADLVKAIDEHYAALVTPELLAVWKADPTKMPGRTTSSPWPDYIDITTVTKKTTDTYTVEAQVVERTSANVENGGETARYHAEIDVTKRGDAWLISSFTKGAYLSTVERVTVRGTFACLPHKNTTGPITLECAFGVKSDAGGYYAIDGTLLATTVMTELATGERIVLEGVLVPVDKMAAGLQKYDVKGQIRAASLGRI